MNDTTDHILWYDGPGEQLLPEPDECPVCGSTNTFATFDKKLVCRTCWQVSDIQ